MYVFHVYGSVMHGIDAAYPQAFTLSSNWHALFCIAHLKTRKPQLLIRYTFLIPHPWHTTILLHEIPLHFQTTLSLPFLPEQLLFPLRGYILRSFKPFSKISLFNAYPNIPNLKISKSHNPNNGTVNFNHKKTF